MDIHWFESLDSTQSYLIEELKLSRLHAPICIGASLQTSGKGSRGNNWVGEEGNLFISVAIERSMLPHDLKLESSSIYLAFLMKQLLNTLGSTLWLKWPNDFYLGNKKVGGVITNLVEETLVCGIGINLISAPEDFEKIDIAISPYDLTKAYSELFKNLPSWKQIFSNYRIEFENSREFFTHNNNEKVTLERAVLLEDGSLMCDGQRIFSLR
ncbi:biotin--[acetyl-CoA-carboxylase] ligase [Sulfuricurvum sp. RIFCSPLOWO2_12_FULL_43_24]|uniref:biotin--[acetyl-CoA-carboxylase] ligase n=1 Tax=Sulfuricurvum sp. RIFCSPLOWO2_12_FULL_43_24 TaxID=1802247 RepID=UPI0008AD2BEC|nr:biotin--[acetyl-CoA-carboxylase] ligase [Sulfuricurvum sp. RIFCSPLOWO2_12_FULL_43_24]OHD83958.1 MAG: biotin--[acetyl-CoA-carboxylase] ligase [Sulfuricurvum sp. RIFCSPLOWO2_02_43_6]OHD86918.1 MAG: biotin--[acetyl-CoA-carboxylase] ligase [Sulfuricurvum sp. RIFCSPLOWO2_02_FULL_43_45]OHD90711.1 MAG: biotin--[acetyl-CoA-carboxylase] ligase [Sulfuricurvum sp. RIFCSPLOWO2_12_FULL_43_24]